MIGDPKHPSYFCKLCGPEKVLRSLGIPVVKAQAADKCGQISDVKGFFKEVLIAFFTKGPSAAVELVRSIYRKP